MDSGQGGPCKLRRKRSVCGSEAGETPHPAL